MGRRRADRRPGTERGDEASLASVFTHDLVGLSYDELLALYRAGEITKAQFAKAYVPAGNSLPVTIIGGASINWWVIGGLVGAVIYFGARLRAK